MNKWSKIESPPLRLNVPSTRRTNGSKFTCFTCSRVNSEWTLGVDTIHKKEYSRNDSRSNTLEEKHSIQWLSMRNYFFLLWTGNSE